MFDGAELSMVYGTQTTSQQAQPEVNIPKSTESHATPPEPIYVPPPAMYAEQPGKNLSNTNTNNNQIVSLHLNLH